MAAREELGQGKGGGIVVVRVSGVDNGGRIEFKGSSREVVKKLQSVGYQDCDGFWCR